MSQYGREANLVSLKLWKDRSKTNLSFHTPELSNTTALTHHSSHTPQYLWFLLSFWLMNRLNVNWYIDGHRFNKDFMIDYRYCRSKIENLLLMDRYYRWSAWPIVPIDSIGIDPIDPSPILPSNAPHEPTGTIHSKPVNPSWRVNNTTAAKVTCRIRNLSFHHVPRNMYSRLNSH